MPSGALSSIHYGFESAFQTQVGTAHSFGPGAKISGLERNNNIEIIYGLGDREGTNTIAKQFAGTVSIESILSEPWIFKAFLGDTYSASSTNTGKATPTTLDGEVARGSSSFDVVNATGLTDGDIILITGSDPNTYEIRKVNGAPVGNVVAVDKPFYYTHATGKAVTEIGGTGPTTYYHIFRNSNSSVIPLTIDNSMDLAADYQTRLLGCVGTSFGISASVNEAIVLTTDYAFGKEDPSDSPAFQAQAPTTFIPYSFSHGNFYFPGNKTLATGNVQSADVKATANVDLIYGLGNRNATANVPKQFEYTIDAAVLFTDKTDLMSLFRDGTTSYNTGDTMTTVAESGLCLHFNNGTNTFAISFGGVTVDTESLPQEISAPVIENVSLKARSCHIYALNTTSEIPSV